MNKYLLLLLVPILSFASIGKITVLKGDVKIQRDGGTIQAKSGTSLEKSDFIKTDKNGKVQIVFTDKTIFTVGKNSTLDIADYLYDEAQPKKNKAQFNVLKGAFSSITGRIGKLNKSKFKLKTKSASIGIRGTIVVADQDTVMCTEGLIDVTANDGTTVLVNAGYKTDTSTGTAGAEEKIQQGDVESMGLGLEDDAGETTKNKDSKKKRAEAQEQQNDALDQASDVNKDKASDSTVVTEDVTLSGYTKPKNVTTVKAISSFTGKVINDKLVISADDASGVLGKMIMTDDQGNELVGGSDEKNIAWGHWENDSDEKWVVGQETSSATLDSYRQSNVNASYQGKVMGTVGSDAIKMDSTNSVDLNFNFKASAADTMSGNIDFDTASGKEWRADIDSGTVTGTTFSSTNITDDGSTNAVTSGRVDGAFYGDNADAVGGAFNLGNGTDTATGVFKADKQ